MGTVSLKFSFFLLCVVLLLAKEQQICVRAEEINLDDYYLYSQSDDEYSNSSNSSESQFDLLDDYEDDLISISTSSALMLLENYGISLLSTYTPYTGNIGEPYLTYLQSYASSRPVTDSYVAYVTQESVFSGGQTRTSTVYNIAIGDIKYIGSSFTGSVTIYKIYQTTTYFPHFATVSDSSFVLNVGTGLVYASKSLGSPYPDFIATDSFSRYTFFLLCAFAVFYTLSCFFRRQK